MRAFQKKHPSFFYFGLFHFLPSYSPIWPHMRAGETFVGTLMEIFHDDTADGFTFVRSVTKIGSPVFVSVDV
jgi:hypothetical protein